MYKAVTNLAIQAGDKILEYYKEPIQIEAKSDNSPLTQADLAAHKIISDGLEKITPNIPVISEEGGIADYEEREKWTTFWLVDPLDGTKEFIKKNGEFTVNIALIEHGIPVFGVVYIPATRVTYTGNKDKGSFKIDESGTRRQIFSSKPDLAKPVTIVSSRSHGNDEMDRILNEKSIQIGKKIPAGSSLKFCLVAEGKADLYPRLGPTMEWDTAAGDAVFRYSGIDSTRKSDLQYNKKNLLNGEFILGLE